MSSQTTRDTRAVPFAGRTVVIKLPTDGQLALLSHYANVMKRGTGATVSPNAIAAMGEFINIVGHLFNDEDRAFVVDLLAAGTVEIPDVMALLNEFNEGKDAKPAKAAVRRGR